MLIDDGWWYNRFVTDDGGRERRVLSLTSSDGDAKTAGNEIAINLVGDKLAGDCDLTVAGVSFRVDAISSP